MNTFGLKNVDFSPATFVPTIVAGGGHVPMTPELFQNFPNSFNPTTVIRYKLAQEEHVKLSVLDLLGREVAVLVDGRQGPGGHEVGFDGRRLSSGAYYCRFSAGTFSVVRKLVVVR